MPTAMNILMMKLNDWLDKAENSSENISFSIDNAGGDATIRPR